MVCGRGRDGRGALARPFQELPGCCKPSPFSLVEGESWEEEQRALYLSLPALEYSLIVQEQGVTRPFVRVKYGQTPSIRRNRRSGSRFRMNGHGYLDQFEPRTPRVSGLGCVVGFEHSRRYRGMPPHPNAHVK